MHHDFKSWRGTRGDIDEDNGTNSGPITRSSVDAPDDWILNKEAFTMEITDCRRLPRVAIKSLAVTAVHTSFLLLVSTDADKKLIKVQAA